MTALNALKELVKTILLPYFLPLAGFLLALMGAVPPILEKWSSKKELVCMIVRSVPEKQGREVTIRVTNKGYTQFIPDGHAHLRFFFGKSAVIHRVVARSGISDSALSIEKKYLVVTPPFLNTNDSFSFSVYLQDHHVFQAISHIEGIQHIWWERPVPWKKRLVNRDLLFLGYDVFLVGFLVALPWEVIVFRAVAPFAWILKTPLYSLLLVLGLVFLGMGLWQYISRLTRHTKKSPRLVVKRLHHP